MTRWASLLICAFWVGAVQASEISETFFSRAFYSSGTAVWNQALGVLHPTLRVMDYKPGFTPLDFSVGDGSDGVFDVSTYAAFSQNGDISGNIVRLDTGVHPVLNVTLFNLAAGWTLQPVGPNPLIIRSLSDVTIEGIILCQGDNGQSGSGTTPGVGGSGRCGGQNGGAGGALSGAGVNGTNDSLSVTGGQGGNFTGGAAVGGGGGGSWSADGPPTDGTNSSGAGGQAGAFISDPTFSTIGGGAGGGGGSGTTTDVGGGGGAGGGAVSITAVRNFNLGSSTDPTIGYILVNGGNGGGASNGGAGGAGGGGSVQVFAGGTINIYNTDASGASQGNGGTGGTNALTATGGSGGLGRSWFSAVFFNGVGTYTPLEEAPVISGDVQLTTVPQTITSVAVDTGNTAPMTFSLTTTPISSDFQLQAAGSSDNFVSDNTGWSTDFSALEGKRYVKFMITITSSNPTDPTSDMVSAINIDFSPFIMNDYKFAGCGHIEGRSSPWNALPLLLPLFFLLFSFLALKLNSRQKKARRG